MRALRTIILVAALVGATGCTGTGRPESSSSARAPATARTAASALSSPRTSASPKSSVTLNSATARGTGATSTAPTVTIPPGRAQPGTTIVLNPGHNGGNATAAAAINKQVPAGFGEYKACDTTGTNTNSGYPEHAFNWDVSLRIRKVLQAHGVRVLLTRDSDNGIGPCVDQRAAVGNQPGVAAVISIHADGTADGAGHGFHVCEASRPPAGATIAAQSHALTVAEHDALLSGSGRTASTYLGTNGYYPRSDLAGLNLATVAATFLEIGNMRNPADAAIQTSDAGRQRIANAVAAGVLNWLAAR